MTESLILKSFFSLFVEEASLGSLLNKLSSSAISMPLLEYPRAPKPYLWQRRLDPLPVVSLASSSERFSSSGYGLTLPFYWTRVENSVRMFTCQNRKNPVYHRCIRILPTSSELEGPSPDQRRSWQLPNHRAPWLFQARGALLTPLDDQKSSQAQSSKTNIIFKALDGSYEETGRSETLLSRTSWPFPFYLSLNPISEVALLPPSGGLGPAS